MATTSKGLFGSSLARKYWMAVSGLFLCTFLVGHLLGNLQLFVSGEEGKLAFNEYGHFMTTFPCSTMTGLQARTFYHAPSLMLLTLPFP